MLRVPHSPGEICRVEIPAFLDALRHRLHRRVHRTREKVVRRINRRRFRRFLNQVEPLRVESDSRKATLFFAPDAGIGPHFSAVCIAAKTLQEAGYPVLITRCFKLFDRCPVFSSQRLDVNERDDVKREICLKCAGDSFTALDGYRLPSLDLRNFPRQQLEREVNAALAETPERLLDFEYDSVPFGRLCTVDFALETKICDFDNISPSERSLWLQYIKTSLTGYLLVDWICRNVELERLVHFNDYALMLGARLAANKHGVPATGMTLAYHKNVDPQRFAFYPTSRKVCFRKTIEVWPDWRELAIPSSQIKEITDDTVLRLSGSGSHVYSPGKGRGDQKLHEQLGLDRNKRLLVAYTSSLDELQAARTMLACLDASFPPRPQPFADQLEWLSALTDHVAGRDDLELVVRVHPREGKNKREGVVSEHLGHLKKAFDRPLKHCRFIWPEDPTSSYDLAEIADVALVSWSTIGVELARIGLPVLTSFDLPEIVYPHGEFIHWGATRREYLAKLNDLLDTPTTLDQLLYAYRWYNLYNLELALDLSDLAPAEIGAPLPEFRMPAEASTMIDLIHGEADILDIKLQRLRQSHTDERDRDEADALKSQLRRLIHFLFTGEDTGAPVDFVVRMQNVVSSSAESSHPVTMAEGEANILYMRGNSVDYVCPNGSHSRYSPLIARLAPICATPDVEGRQDHRRNTRVA